MGASTARLVAKNGFAVSILSLENDRVAGEELAVKINDAGGAAAFFPVDIAFENDVVAAYDATVNAFGVPTAAVHAAGIFVSGTILDMDVDATARMIAVNFTGLMICCREAARHMSTERGGVGGSIVNIASMSATIGGRPGACVYAATKGAVRRLHQRLCQRSCATGYSRQHYSSRRHRKPYDRRPGGQPGT